MEKKSTFYSLETTNKICSQYTKSIQTKRCVVAVGRRILSIYEQHLAWLPHSYILFSIVKRCFIWGKMEAVFHYKYMEALSCYWYWRWQTITMKYINFCFPIPQALHAPTVKGERDRERPQREYKTSNSDNNENNNKMFIGFNCIGLSYFPPS